MRSTLNNIAILLIFLLMFVIITQKVIHVNNLVFFYTGERFFGGMCVFINDSIIFAVIFALFGVSYCQKTPFFISIFMRFIAFIFLFIYILDFYLIVNFNNRLSLNDIFKYSNYAYNYLNQIYFEKAFIIIIIGLFIIFLMLIVILNRHNIKNKYIARLSLILSLILAILTLANISTKNKYIHSWIYKNFINYNFEILSEAKAYSNKFINNFSFKVSQTCSSKKIETPRIIILMVESLSPYQSKYFSGINNWTPNLDEIAKKSFAYKNFYANGFTTEDGEISLLTGKLPIYKPASYTPGGGTAFNGFFDTDESLPTILKKQGYVTAFMSTADLEFGNTGDWAKSIGFDYVEGHEHSYYNKWNRFQFKAAPDEALYNRVIQKISTLKKDKYFIFIKTVSSHHPFKNPETGNISEEETFKYVDRQIGTFYNKLVKMDFFDNGILIIVGDHHAMIPLKNKEIKLYGQFRASAIVPLIVIYDGKHYLDSKQYQQVDVFNSLKGLVTGSQCHSDWIGDIFGRIPAKYIATRRGDNRNIISVFSGKKTMLVKLDGDDTRLISTCPKNKKVKREIVNEINLSRISNKN